MGTKEKLKQVLVHCENPTELLLGALIELPPPLTFVAVVLYTALAVAFGKFVL